MSRIHTEMVLFRQTSARIAHLDGNQWWTRAGVWTSRAGMVATAYGVVTSSIQVWSAAQPYIRDVQRRCDNNYDTAADLATALGNLAQQFANSFNLGEFWIIYQQFSFWH